MTVAGYGPARRLTGLGRAAMITPVARTGRARRGKGETMSAENVSVLRDAYGAFARQDIPGVMAAFDENIEWQAPDSLPFGGLYRGHDGVGGFFGQLPTYWQELSVEPEEFIDGGDTIVVVARVRGTAAGGSLD